MMSAIDIIDDYTLRNILCLADIFETRAVRLVCRRWARVYNPRPSKTFREITNGVLDADAVWEYESLKRHIPFHTCYYYFKIRYKSPPHRCFTCALRTKDLYCGCLMRVIIRECSPPVETYDLREMIEKKHYTCIDNIMRIMRNMMYTMTLELHDIIYESAVRHDNPALAHIIRKYGGPHYHLSRDEHTMCMISNESYKMFEYVASLGDTFSWLTLCAAIRSKRVEFVKMILPHLPQINNCDIIAVKQWVNIDRLNNGGKIAGLIEEKFPDYCK